MIELKGLTKTFGAFKAVDGLSLRVPPGEIYGFLGPNGAGKTTTVKILSGIMKPSAGSVVVDGVDMLADPLAAKRHLAYIPDEPFAYPKLTGRELLRFIGDLYSVPRGEQEREIPKLLETFDLSEAGGELLESYSHGMKQKLLIASVLLRRPKVVLFDEPTVGLDPRSIRRFRELLLGIARSGAGVFMCTHILEMAEKLCGRVGIIYKGKLIAEGTVEDLRRMSGASGGHTLEDIFLALTED